MKPGTRSVHPPGLVFVRCALDDVPRAARDGITVLDADICGSPRDDRARAAEALLVAESKGELQSGFNRFEAADLLNADPYRPPRTVVAGGGLVIRHVRGRAQLLLIFRRGVWDLPKGKLDRGETVAQCAIREVNEELGITDASIVSPVGKTVHGYPDGKHYAVKTTHWFLMRSAAERFVPQAAEQIEAVGWFHVEDAIRHLAFEALRTLLISHAGLFVDEPVNGAA